MGFWSWKQTTSGQRKLYNTSLSRHKLKYEMPWLWSVGINHAESFMNDSWLSVWRGHGGSWKAPTLLRMGVLREGGLMFSLGWRRVAICIITQAQCAWAVSGPTRHHLGLGNDNNSFLMTEGASREERWTILNEDPVEWDSRNTCPEGGPMALKHGSLWSCWLCMSQRAQRLTQTTGSAWARLACPWQKPLYTD